MHCICTKPSVDLRNTALAHSISVVFFLRLHNYDSSKCEKDSQVLKRYKTGSIIGKGIRMKAIINFLSKNNAMLHCTILCHATLYYAMQCNATA